MRARTLISVLLGSALTGLGACSDEGRNPGDPFDPQTGAIVVELDMTGTINPTDACAVMLDGVWCGQLGHGCSLALPSVEPGTHDVALSSVRPLCDVAEGRSQRVEVEAGGTSYVHFSVICNEEKYGPEECPPWKCR
ncbi:MAG: hypothetical protein JSU87_11465 [Gemmatimonadota bacterium]|nr:MAG: hypothetical protein JSU87_11465 [Gemmatimonadota bacterium]